MNQKLANAKALYLDGIRDGKVAEHWDSVEAVPENPVNGGKF